VVYCHNELGVSEILSVRDHCAAAKNPAITVAHGHSKVRWPCPPRGNSVTFSDGTNVWWWCADGVEVGAEGADTINAHPNVNP
jgi:hypothetical protein